MTFRRSTRWLARIPILLYRWRLGWLLGKRFLLLTHRGRRTGKPRQTVLEVVGTGPEGPVVASGWGEKADWLRNLEDCPSVHVNWAGHQFPAAARRLDRAQARLVFATYVEEHPFLAPLFLRLFTGLRAESPAQLGTLMAERFPLVAMERRLELMPLN